MKLGFVVLCLLVISKLNDAQKTRDCGCKTMRPCYLNMLDLLTAPTETRCVSNASIGTSTMHVYLRAVSKYCPDIVSLDKTAFSIGIHELYAVTIAKDIQNAKDGKVIFIDAGQTADSDSVRLALYLIERLLACAENEPLIEAFKWVILPSTNPDGLEIKRAVGYDWYKNSNGDGKDVVGVDLTRNFDAQWNLCPHGGKWSHEYPGSKPNSENETVFIVNHIEKNKQNIKAYISLRDNGHGLHYPNTHNNEMTAKNETLLIARKVADKVNNALKLSFYQSPFAVSNIFQANGMIPACGSSVSYVSNAGVDLAFEMRVYNHDVNQLVSSVKQLPDSMYGEMTNAYFEGFKTLCSEILKSNGDFY